MPQTSSQATTWTENPSPSLRLWPGIVLVLVQWTARFIVPIFMPDAVPFGVLTVFATTLLLILWWLFLSRARWTERLGAVVLAAACLSGMPYLLDESIATAMMGKMFIIYALPVLSLAFVVWAVVTQNRSNGFRRATMLAVIVLTCGVWGLLKTNGMSGESRHDFAWRWTPTPEERFLAQADDIPSGRSARTLEAGADWPGFRGPNRDGVVRGSRIATDWTTLPPVELWRRQVGPSCSSFAVRGGLVYTQEQRGDDEAVSCYDLNTGEPVWRYQYAARFWDSHAGAGPRSTPTLSDGRIYTSGATGILTALDAMDGSPLWSRNVAADTGQKIPGWGFSSSPIVIGELVVAATSGTLVAYDKNTGEKQWVSEHTGYSYSSPHWTTIDGIGQLVLLSGDGAFAFSPVDGTRIWSHEWPGNSRIVQPAFTADGDLLIGSGFGQGVGMRRLAVTRAGEDWQTEERWTSVRLRPYFNDFVVHRGHVYGFDGNFLTCLDSQTGDRCWKGGRYGSGQVVLLADQDLLLVMAEKGAVALVEAKPDQFTEQARIQVVEGKTWNHPVLAGDVLLVRNTEEIVALRLPEAPL